MLPKLKNNQKQSKPIDAYNNELQAEDYEAKDFIFRIASNIDGNYIIIIIFVLISKVKNFKGSNSNPETSPNNILRNFFKTNTRIGSFFSSTPNGVAIIKTKSSSSSTSSTSESNNMINGYSAPPTPSPSLRSNTSTSSTQIGQNETPESTRQKVVRPTSIR